MGHSNHADPAKQIYYLCVGDDIKAALDAITDSSISKPYVVYLNAGVYSIGDQVLNVPAYVTLKALGGDVILDYTGNTTQKAMTLASGAKVTGVAIQNHLSSSYAFEFTSAGSFILDDITFLDVSRCILVNHASARPTIRRPVFLPFGDPMVVGIKVETGSPVIYDIRTGGSLAITDLFWASGASTRPHIFGLFSEQTAVVNGLRVSSGATLDANEVIIRNATKGCYIESGGELILRAGIMNENDYGCDVTGSGSVFQGFNVSFLDNTVFNYQAGAGTISKGFGISDPDYFNIDPGAALQAHFLTTSSEDESLTCVAELHVGHPTFPRESAFGGGDSYVNGMLVYNYTALTTTFTDVTAEAKSPAGSTFTMGNAINDAVYLGSRVPVQGPDFHRFYGIKFLTTVATVLGAGSIVAEYWNGSSWTAFSTMTSEAAGQYYRKGSTSFSVPAGSYQVRFAPAIAVDWTKNDPMTLGTNYYWVRFRVATAITSGATFQQIKLHTNRTELNADGYREMFGVARAYYGIPVFWNSFQDLGTALGDTDLWRSTNCRSGFINNNFNSDGDSVGAAISLPRWVDTSAPLRVEVVVLPSVGGTLQMRAYLNTSKDTDPADTVRTSDPASTTGEVSATVSHTVVAGVQKTFQFDLSLSNKGIEASGTPAEVLWLNVAAVTRPGNVYGISFLVKGLMFRDGEHL